LLSQLFEPTINQSDPVDPKRSRTKETRTRAISTTDCLLTVWVCLPVIIIIISLILTMTSIETYPRRETSKYASTAVTAVKGLPEEKREKGAAGPSAELIRKVIVVRV
jgi:hypothetical protein